MFIIEYGIINDLDADKISAWREIKINVQDLVRIKVRVVDVNLRFYRFGVRQIIISWGVLVISIIMKQE